MVCWVDTAIPRRGVLFLLPSYSHPNPQTLHASSPLSLLSLDFVHKLVLKFSLPEQTNTKWVSLLFKLAWILIGSRYFQSNLHYLYLRLHLRLKLVYIASKNIKTFKQIFWLVLKINVIWKWKIYYVYVWHLCLHFKLIFVYLFRFFFCLLWFFFCLM